MSSGWVLGREKIRVRVPAWLHLIFFWWWFVLFVLFVLCLVFLVFLFVMIYGGSIGKISRDVGVEDIGTGFFFLA